MKMNLALAGGGAENLGKGRKMMGHLSRINGEIICMETKTRLMGIGNWGWIPEAIGSGVLLTGYIGERDAVYSDDF